MTRRLCFFLISLALLVLSPAAADTWAPPQVRTYYSQDQRTRLTVTPRGIENIEDTLAYFEEDGDSGTRARGVLERLDQSGGWVTAWDRPLLNDVAPVSALVAPSGRYVVTFDDWHFVGTREHVVVVYGGDGHVIRSLALSDIVPESYIGALPRSVSSIRWGGEHVISPDGERLIMQIVIPTGAASPTRPEYAERIVELSTGIVSAPDNAAWQAALDRANRAATQQQAERDAADARFRAPMAAPTSANEGLWFAYLREVFYRVDPDWSDSYAGTNLLRSLDAPDYARSETYLCNEFTDTLIAPATMLGSLASPEHFLDVLERCVAQAPPNRFEGKRIYVVISPAFEDRVRSALERTGASVFIIDPERALPQRPERIERRDAGRRPD